MRNGGSRLSKAGGFFSPPIGYEIGAMQGDSVESVPDCIQAPAPIARIKGTRPDSNP